MNTVNRNSTRLLTQPRRGLRREEAAIYVGVSARKFDEWVARGVMPKPKRQDGIVLWDVERLGLFFDALPDEEAMIDPSEDWGKS